MNTLFDFPLAPEENPPESNGQPEVKTPAEEKFNHLTQCIIRIQLDADRINKAVEIYLLNLAEMGQVYGEYAKLVEKEKEMKNGNQESKE